jgi:hypothetical protein
MPAILLFLPLDPNKSAGTGGSYADSADVIAAQIEVSQRCALPQHSCKTFCPACAYLIPAAIEVSERCALPQHSEIEVTQPLCTVAALSQASLTRYHRGHAGGD